VKVLDGMLSVLDTHEFVFARLMGLADARVYYVLIYPSSPFDFYPSLIDDPPLGVTPRAGADDSSMSEIPRKPNGAVKRTTPLTPRHRRQRPRKMSYSQL
jgi:hypothetical protein